MPHKTDEKFIPSKSKIWWEISVPLIQKLASVANVTKGADTIFPALRQNITNFGVAIEMYINPQNISYEDSKIVTATRTKGGYIVQYWGEELGTINLTGHTSTAGIEGINLLRFIYRAESIMREAGQIADVHMAKIVTGIKMHYRGVTYSGFFRSMSVTENADRNGLFDYLINFAVTNVFGRWQERNFMPWHKDITIANGSYAGVLGPIKRLPVKL